MRKRRISYKDWVPKETREWFDRLSAGSDALNQHFAFKHANVGLIERILTDSTVNDAGKHVIQSLSREGVPLHHLHVFLLFASIPAGQRAPVPTSSALKTQLAKISRKTRELAGLLNSLPPYELIEDVAGRRMTTVDRLLDAQYSPPARLGLNRAVRNRAEIAPSFLMELADEVELEAAMYAAGTRRHPRNKEARGETFAIRNTIIDDLIYYAATFLSAQYPNFLAAVATAITGRPIASSSIRERARAIRA